MTLPDGTSTTVAHSEMWLYYKNFSFILTNNVFYRYRVERFTN